MKIHWLNDCQYRLTVVVSASNSVHFGRGEPVITVEKMSSNEPVTIVAGTGNYYITKTRELYREKYYYDTVWINR